MKEISTKEGMRYALTAVAAALVKEDSKVAAQTGAGARITSPLDLNAEKIQFQTIRLQGQICTLRMRCTQSLRLS